MTTESHFLPRTPSLIDFFRNYAGQNQFRLHMGTTYVAVQESEVIGFVTVAATSIVARELTARQRKRLPKYPLPTLRIARLGVAMAAKGQGLGKQLLRFALQVARDMSRLVGCIGVVVDAKPDAIAFYEKYGFEALEVVRGKLGDRPLTQPMYLPIVSIPTENK